MPIQNMYMGHPNVSATKWMIYDALGYGMSWVRVVLLPTLPSKYWNSWNALLSIILHITIDFHYKAMYNYHQLVSLLFLLLDWMSLNKNDDWCPFASRSRLESRSRWLLTHWIFSPGDWIYWHWNSTGH